MIAVLAEGRGGVAALRPVTVQAFAVPTGGMERTLLSGDVYFSREVPREEPALPGRIRWERIGQRLR